MIIERGLIRSRWRAFGLGFALAAGLGCLVGVIEALGSDAHVDLAGIAYSINLHLLAVLAVTLVILVAAWRSSEQAFPLLALAGAGALEGGIVLAYWIGSRGFFPSVGLPLGKIAAAGTVAAGLLTGLIPAFLLRRTIRRMSRLRLAGRILAPAGLLLAVGIAAVNLVIAWRVHSREPEIQLRAGIHDLERPDVFIILVDALRRDHVSFFGYERPTTPNIDALLHESRVFTNAWTPSVSTIPSVASLFTGVYPSSHRICSPLSRVPDDAPLLAEHFRSYGYRTGAFIANQTLAGRNGYTAGFETFVPALPPWWCHHQRLAFEQIVQRLRRSVHSHAAWEMNRRMLAWVRANEGHPRFAYLHYLEPHSPYNAGVTDRQAVAPEAPPGPRIPPLFVDYHGPDEQECRDWECLSKPPHVTPADREGMVANYDAELHQVDRRLGSLLEELKKTGVLERAHVIFCNDHGEQFGDHDGWGHSDAIYEELIGCPLAWRPPGGVPGGQVIPDPISILDLLRTVCVHAGLEVPPLHQGRELPAQWFTNSEAAETGRTRSGFRHPVLAELPPNLFALRSGRWKLIRRGLLHAPSWQLYDLEADPGERINLAAAWPDTLAHLRGLMEGTVAHLQQSGLGEIETLVDPLMLEEMRSLGYIR